MDEEDNIPTTDDTLPGEPEQKRAAMEVGHEKAMESLVPEAPPDSNPSQHDEVLTDLSPESLGQSTPSDHSQAMDDLSPQIGEPPPNDFMQPLQVSVEDLNTPIPNEGSKPEPGRFYVPPENRTPENRGERRAEHDRILNEMRKSVEKNVDGFEPVPEFQEDFADRQSEGFEQGVGESQMSFKVNQSQQNIATLGMFATLADSTLDISHELERMRFSMEQNRL